MADRQVGEILGLLQELQIDDDTVVFLCGDNGANTRVFLDDQHPHGFFTPNVNPQTGDVFRAGKGSLYDGGLRVADLVRWPGKIAAGAVSDHLGYFPDVLPTLAELAGADIPDQVDGISFLPTLLGKRQTARHDSLYWEIGTQVAVRQANWKAVKPNTKKPWELYDIRVDPGEQQDLAKQYPDVIQRLKSLAKNAHSPPQHGTVFDRSLRFEGHSAK